MGDGKTSGVYRNNSCTHTHRSKNAWWRVDLRQSYSIQRVQVFNRADCCGNRLNGFVVRVGDNDTWKNSKGQCGGRNNIRQGGSKSVKCGGKRGRYVYVVLAGKTNYLTLCEVRVYGIASGNSHR